MDKWSFLQKSGRLYPKSIPSWLHSQRCTAWHRALWLLYLGQVAYFCASTWGNDWYRWNLEFSRAHRRLFFFFSSENKRGRRGWQSHTNWHKLGFCFGVSVAKSCGIPQPFLKISASHEHHTWPGHFCLRFSYQRVTHLQGIQTHFRDLIFPFIVHSLCLSIEMSWI